MEQERVAMKVADVYKVTGELILKAMYYAMEETASRLQAHAETKTFTRETNWNRFMATSETKHFETFLNSEVDSERLEDYLKGYEVGFSIKDNRNGTSTIAIDAKNVQALEASFKGVINDLTDPNKAEKLKENLVKSPKNMTVTEKLAYYKKQVKAEIKAKAKIKAKTPKKALAKEEKGL
ncbi:TPA: hypothetical protein TT917_001559 [Streptococcus equi subsp. zooepidemicus]|uniref:Conjugative transposon protein n=1 Tax=Streptococcus equi subsp. zooepidemicus TaxID=40041 RepID=A0A7Z8ZTW5_STRSZ|nr:hypothetical protein [Streptococcus equi]KIS13093.1 conjugative transposon protein [Streptococcus equi subsp. zooepidemicus SzAM60]MCD3401581.1 hypothetical protein [Streptococcus equi subsp. zooepidemicus]VEF04894.1 Uncharacterised protein [Streptococcus equi subsp. zooepidemicus]HEL0020205.1 hypothetical protein [Streptococcus equi subsp. zooepidemicus]HEL0022703.1 hypothetical protein [Streptococcus equi subsp. zooepidemicus]